jgi:hypothetical protein
MACVANSSMKLTFGLLAIVGAGLTIALPRIMAASQSAVHVQAVSSHGCVDEYNALLLSAKAALKKGDRATALSLLQGAKRKASQCPDLQEPEESQVLAFNAP